MSSKAGKDRCPDMQRIKGNRDIVLYRERDKVTRY